jgi:hypothetical protein
VIVIKSMLLPSAIAYFRKAKVRQSGIISLAQLLTSDSKIFRRQQQEHPIASIPPPTTPILSSQTIEGPQTGL